MTEAAEIAARLDRATETRRLLEHPFYRAWAEGSLTRDDLKVYAGQYWRQVEAFPGYLEKIGAGLDAPAAKDIVERNRRDEVGDDHAGLWLAFAAALGAREEEVRSAPIEPETRECVNAFAAAPARSSSFALGMIYGYESQTPAVAATKREGLIEHYGLSSDATAYFELHGELDVEHARELSEAIALTPGVDIEEAEAGARSGAEAIWRLMDGVERVRHLSTA